MLWHVMSAVGGQGHRALAVTTVLLYAAFTVASIVRHSEHAKCKHMVLRAVSLLRDAARASLRADRSKCPEDKYMDAVSARIYVRAVERLMSSADVKAASSISLDELRQYTDNSLDQARAELERSCGSNNNRQQGLAAVGYPSAAIPSYEIDTNLMY